MPTLTKNYDNYWDTLCKSLVHMLKKAICERGHNIIMWTVIAKEIYKGEIKADNDQAVICLPFR